MTNSDRKLRAYIAGPITSSGSLHENLQKGIKVGEEVRQIGIHPFIPHLYDFTKIVTGGEAEWEDMLQLDENFILACDLIIALPGESKGKEREIVHGAANGIPTLRLGPLTGPLWLPSRCSPQERSELLNDDDWEKLTLLVEQWEQSRKISI